MCFIDYGYITGQWAEFTVKNPTLYLNILSWLLFLILFFIKKLVSLPFSFLFWWSIEFPQQNICQSETGIGDTKLLLELYAMGKSKFAQSINFLFLHPVYLLVYNHAQTVVWCEIGHYRRSSISIFHNLFGNIEKIFILGSSYMKVLRLSWCFLIS